MKKRCNVFTLWKSITLSVKERNRCCGGGVSLTFLAVMRCSLIFSAVLRCSEPPHVPLNEILHGIRVTALNAIPNL